MKTAAYEDLAQGPRPMAAKDHLLPKQPRPKAHGPLGTETKETLGNRK